MGDWACVRIGLAVHGVGFWNENIEKEIKQILDRILSTFKIVILSIITVTEYFD